MKDEINNNQQPSKNGGESHDLSNNLGLTSPADIKEKLLKEIKEELDRGITRNKVLPLDWAMDRIEPILVNAIEETSKAKDEEFIKTLIKLQDDVDALQINYANLDECKKSRRL